MEETILLDNSKYRFHMDEGTLQCERYGERWRDFIGDHAVSLLFQECLTVMACLQELINIIDNSPEDIDSFTTQPAKAILKPQ